MYCGKCGTNIKAGNSFCTSCGEKADFDNINLDKTFNEALSSVSNALNAMESICYEITKRLKTGLKQDLDVGELLKKQILHYCQYLFFVDGKVVDSQAKIINHCFDYDFSSSQYMTSINIANAELGFSADYSKKLPLSFEVFDLFRKAFDSSGSATGQAVDSVIETYNLVGNFFIGKRIYWVGRRDEKST